MKVGSFALVALTSLFWVTIAPVLAQQPEAPQATEQPTAEKVVPDTSPIVIESDKTVQAVQANGQSVVVRGKVEGDIHVVNGNVTVEPEGRVNGTIYIAGGNVENRSKQKVHIAVAGGNVEGMYTGLIATVPRAEAQAKANSSEHWRSGQFALLLLGMLGALILNLVAPRAAAQASNAVGLEPARSVVAGILAALALGLVTFINAGMIQSPLGFVWAPVGFVVVSATLVLIGYGWLCGMRFLGDAIARRLGQTQSGAFFWRTTLGLMTCFVLGLLPFSPLNIVVTLVQTALSVMGLGALCITGLGTQSNWLGTRMRRGGFRARRP